MFDLIAHVLAAIGALVLGLGLLVGCGGSIILTYFELGEFDAW